MSNEVQKNAPQYLRRSRSSSPRGATRRCFIRERIRTGRSSCDRYRNGDAGSDGELIETVTLSDGTTALITQHAALPLDESILKPKPNQPDATTVKEATEYPGILPAEMIPFSFDTSGEDLVVEGTTPTQLADSGDLELTSITAVTRGKASIARQEATTVRRRPT